MPLRKLSLRDIRSRPLRSLLTLLSIVIGVGAIVAISLASTSAQLAQMAMVRAVTGNSALEIEAVGGMSFDGKILETIEGIPGIEVASPVIRRYSKMFVGDPRLALEQAESAGEKKEPISYRVQLLGVVPSLDRSVRSYSLVEGAWLEDAPTDVAAVLMDAGFAASAKAKVGSDIYVATSSSLQRQKAIVVGLIKPTDASAGIQSGVLVADLKTVQRWSRSTGKLDAIQLVLKKDAKPDVVLPLVKRELPSGLNVREPTLRSEVAGESTVAMQQGLRLAAAFALVISTLIIYNTFQMNVGERRRQLGILRSLGATRKQLLWMVVREGLWLGTIGTVLGCVIGHIGASILRTSTARLLQIDVPPAPWSVWPYLLAATSGLFVALLGAFFPAYRASRLSPSEAMRVVATGEFATSRAGWITLGSGMIAIGLMVQFLSISHTIDVKHVVVGAVLMKVGVVFLLPGVIADLSWMVVRVLNPVLRTEGKLARRQLLRHRSRTSLTTGIVFIAMGLGLGMASTILDHVRNVEGWYQRAIVGDFFIRAAMPDMNSGQSADMPYELTQKVADIPGVSLVDTLRFVRARSNETSLVVVVRKFNSSTQDYFDLTEGKDGDVMQGVRRGDVVLGSVLSQRLNLHLGDTIPLETNDGSTTLRIAGVTNEYIAGGLTLYMESESAKRLLNVEGTDVIVVRAMANERPAVEKSLRAICDDTGMMFQSYVDLVNVIRGTLNGVVGGLWAVLVLGSIIAAFGLINTLAMNILEQTREIGMLRVVAMTRGQIRKMVLAQALIMGLLGIVPGVVTGIWIAYVINLTTMPVTGHDVKFQFYPWLLFGALGFELAIVVIAAMIPAERAARLNLSSALQYE